jgi:high-affinity iron transporter
VGGTFVITLREGFEAALLLGIVYTYLEKIGARRQFRYVTRGGLLGLLASLALGMAVTFLSGPLVDLGPDLIGAGVLFGAAGVLTWHGWWMRQHARAITGELQHRIDTAQATQQFWIVGLIAFAGVFREGAETVLFLWGLLTQAAGSGGAGGVLGGIIGLLTAAALGVAVFRGGRRLSLSRFFAITSGFILFVAAGLFSTGVGRLQGLGFLPSSANLWDSSDLLDERSFLGSFLSGLVGYRARPSVWEVAAYVAYLALAGWIMFRPSGPAAPGRPDAPGRARTAERPAATSSSAPTHD